jgi:hypothetical protein
MQYIKNRLNERSTYMLIVAGITAASALPGPWAYVSFAVSLVAAFVPDGAVSK